MVADPWWQRKGCGEARFEPDGRVVVTWPEVEGERLDPFAALGMRISDHGLGWSEAQLTADGRVVQLLFDGRPGPQEVVCRHPGTWGWVLYSQGTVWTSWEMPRCSAREGERGAGLPLRGRAIPPHEDFECSDPLLREENLRNLPSGLRRDF